MSTKQLYQFIKATKPKKTAWDQNNNLIVVTSDLKKLVIEIDKKGL